MNSTSLIVLMVALVLGINILFIWFSYFQKKVDGEKITNLANNVFELTTEAFFKFGNVFFRAKAVDYM